MGWEKLFTGVRGYACDTCGQDIYIYLFTTCGYLDADCGYQCQPGIVCRQEMSGHLRAVTHTACLCEINKPCSAAVV
jgi:hypothetical protein